MEVSKEFRIEYAHKLENHSDECANLHGHSGRLIVTLSGEVKEDGMIVDFNWLKKVVEDSIVKRLDHQYLNDIGVVDFKLLPTAERIAIFIWRTLSRHLDSIEIKFGSDLRLEEVKFYETVDSCVTLKSEHWEHAARSQ